MSNDRIPVDKMVTPVWDGLNVTEVILSEFQHLIYLGSCTIHKKHNTFGEGIEQYGKDMDQHCLDLCPLFNYSTARCENFKVV